MGSATEVIVINCEKDVASLIASQIDSLPEGRSRIAERKNLDGVVVGVIILGTIAVMHVPEILNFIRMHIDLRALGSIRAGENEIKNPSLADIENLKRDYLLQGPLEG